MIPGYVLASSDKRVLPSSISQPRKGLLLPPSAQECCMRKAKLTAEPFCHFCGAGRRPKLPFQAAASHRKHEEEEEDGGYQTRLWGGLRLLLWPCEPIPIPKQEPFCVTRKCTFLVAPQMTLGDEALGGRANFLTASPGATTWTRRETQGLAAIMVRVSQRQKPQ